MTLLWPLPSNRITQGVNPNHVALDIGVPRGTPVIAPAAGRVEARPGNTGYGNHVRLHMDNGYTIILAHLQEFATPNGARVQAGQIVGRSGNSGNSTGPHLHLEVRNQEGRAVPPSVFFNPAQLPPASLFNAPAGYIPPSGRPAGAGVPRPIQRTSMSPPYTSAVSGAVSAAAAGAEAARKANEKAPGLVVLSTPAGPIKLGANIKWGTLLAGLAGSALVVVGAWGLTHPNLQQHREALTKEDAKTILAGAAGLVNPALGVAAQIATSKSARQAVTRAKAAQKSQRAAAKSATSQEG